jgi:transposase
VQPRACAPYRTWTKGKTEAGVKFVKRNVLPAPTFPSFTAHAAHLRNCMRVADRRDRLKQKPTAGLLVTVAEPS